jgi:hypothetical protein
MTTDEAITILRTTVEENIFNGKPTSDVQKRLYEAMLMAIEALKREQWIPCSQEQPKEKGTYLVTVHEWSDDKDNFPDYDYQKVMRMRYSIEDGWRVPTHCPEWINKVMHEDVLAWKIMPEPYKESSEVKK